MPEGDTLYRAARRLQSLVGQTATVEGTARAAQEWSGRLSGRRITSIFSRGKHLVVVFEGDLAVRSHLGMTGVWHLYRTGEQWRKTPGKARLVVTTADHVAVCFAAPEVSAGLLGDIEAEMAHLGP
ncbi:MAG: DNA glycosylase, partial [Acidimicrobiia bacterium]|nr:DNA glycosylase [Acidimicrobiia bacterium]